MANTELTKLHPAWVKHLSSAGIYCWFVSRDEFKDLKEQHGETWKDFVYQKSHGELEAKLSKDGKTLKDIAGYVTAVPTPVLARVAQDHGGKGFAMGVQYYWSK